jgi:hypothetical protein
MGSARIEELLEQLVERQADLLDKLDELIGEIRDIKEELNWIGPTSFASMVVEKLNEVEAAISSLER